MEAREKEPQQVRREREGGDDLFNWKLNLQLCKRTWIPEPGEEAADEFFCKKQKSETSALSNGNKEQGNPTNDDSNIGNESDSDADYDDLDDLALPSDNDDFLDDDGVDEDDKSVHSTATTVSDSSACSNTPSLIGESLEASSLPSQDTAPRKHAWVTFLSLILQENLLSFPWA